MTAPGPLSALPRGAVIRASCPGECAPWCDQCGERCDDPHIDITVDNADFGRVTYGFCTEGCAVAAIEWLGRYAAQQFAHIAPLDRGEMG